ncbi:hypothetical protein AeMF1_001736 [Aphanomyces euteiches]|nr:hypothetical protein AeMF1_001736 [Aphanomyces euteiches]KAH9191801.1 hypothetical protein AeNC1_006221 [Aphanomyces euteiches]
MDEPNEGAPKARESFSERTRMLSPIPLDGTPDMQLQSSGFSITSHSMEAAPDEAIPTEMDHEDVSSLLKETHNDSTIEPEKAKSPRVKDWYTRKLEEKIQKLQSELENAGSQGADASSLNSSFSSSAFKRQRTEGESAALNRLETLRRDLEASRSNENRLRQKYEHDMCLKDDELEKIKRRLKFTMGEEDATQEKLRRVTAQLFELQQAQQDQHQEYEAKLLEKDDEIEELTEKLYATEEKSKRVASETAEVIATLREKLAQAQLQSSSSPVKESVLQSEIRLLREQLEEKSIIANNAMQTLKDAEETIFDAKSLRDMRQRVQVLEQNEAKNLEELRKLRLEAKNHATMKETLTTLYRTQESTERQLKDALSIRVAYDELVAEKKQWQSVFQPLFADPNKGISQDMATNHPAQAVCQLFTSQQHDLETLIDERYQLESQVKKLSDHVAQITKAKLAVEATDAEHEAKIAELTSRLSEVTRSESRLRASNADLVGLLKSYNENNGAGDGQVLIEKLEGELKQAEETIAQLQSAQHSLPSPALLIKKNARVVELEKALEAEKTETVQLRKQLEQVQLAASLLEKRLAKGDVNHDTTKVLHLTSNPSSSAIKQKAETLEMQQLRQDNDRLKEIVQASSVQTPGPKVTLPTPSKSSSGTASHDTVEGLQKMNHRLKEVFREQIAKYRDAVYQATGYKVDLKYPELRLRSIYAEDEADEIKFQFNDGELELLETPFVAGLDQRNMAYLTMCHSIPAFLSAVTLMLFEKQTYQP